MFTKSRPRNAIEAIGLDITTRIATQNAELQELRAMKAAIVEKQKKKQCGVCTEKVDKQFRNDHCEMCGTIACSECVIINGAGTFCITCAGTLCRICIRVMIVKCDRCNSLTCLHCYGVHYCKCDRQVSLCKPCAWLNMRPEYTCNHEESL